MPVELYCDICHSYIPEASKGEGWDTGTLILKVTPWGDRTVIHDYFDYDILCESCVEALKETIKNTIGELQK